MTRLLVSVRDADEAGLGLAHGADLIDAKDPEAGALGALPFATVAAIHAEVGGRALTSAVVGDLDAVDALLAAAEALSRLDLGFVKLGLTPAMTRPEMLGRLGRGLPRRVRAIAVLAAEDGCPDAIVPHLARSGFAGAMIDTRRKEGRRLADWLAPNQLRRFVEACRAERLVCGLAGSLAIGDIGTLAPLGADYLGFRGGLCIDGRRTSPLDPARIAAAAQALAIFATGRGERLALPETA